MLIIEIAKFVYEYIFNIFTLLLSIITLYFLIKYVEYTRQISEETKNTRQDRFLPILKCDNIYFNIDQDKNKLELNFEIKKQNFDFCYIKEIELGSQFEGNKIITINEENITQDYNNSFDIKITTDIKEGGIDTLFPIILHYDDLMGRKIKAKITQTTPEGKSNNIKCNTKIIFP